LTGQRFSDEVFKNSVEKPLSRMVIELHRKGIPRGFTEQFKKVLFWVLGSKIQVKKAQTTS
jgi:hypothetical protein